MGDRGTKYSTVGTVRNFRARWKSKLSVNKVLMTLFYVKLTIVRVWLLKRAAAGPDSKGALVVGHVVY